MSFISDNLDRLPTDRLQAAFEQMIAEAKTPEAQARRAKERMMENYRRGVRRHFSVNEDDGLLPGDAHPDFRRA